MAAEEAGNLKIYWEHFFKAETGTYEKSTWLDLFLAEFLLRVNEGANPKDLIDFCPVSGVVSLVGCELLCGIHRVTSSVNAHLSLPLACLDPGPTCSDREDTQPQTQDVDPAEEPRPQPSSLFSRNNAQSSAQILRKYLLGGVAWRCLVLLKALGVEGVSCCRQLSSVLMWVFGELRGAGAGGGARRTAPALPHTHTPIHQLFSHKIWSKQKVSSTQSSKTNLVAPSEKNYPTSRSRLSQNKTESTDKSKRKHSKPTENRSSESGDSNDDLHIINRSMTIKVTTRDDFTYFESPARSHQPAHTHTSPPHTKHKPKVDDYIADKHKQIINSEITAFEFTLIITDLLQQLCKAESSLSGTEGSQISMQCINFALRNLCSLQFGSLPAQAQYDSLEASHIKVALTELLIVSLDKVLIHSDLCAKLINSGILPMLLRILEDVICKCSRKYRSKEEQNGAKTESPSKTESENLLKFLFGIGYSITAFFHCLLMQCRTLAKLREFTDQFKLYGECLRGGLLQDCVELMMRIPEVEDESVVLVRKVIESIGRLISGMKRVRSEVVHSAACPRARHKACRARVCAGAHHHHGILGAAGAGGAGPPLAAACCVAVLYGTLTALAADERVAAHAALRTRLLRVMLCCGACCCFSPGFLMESAVRLMLTHDGAAGPCLQLLERTVYGELGAGVLAPRLADRLPCAVCEPGDDSRDLVRKYCPHGVSPMERKSMWSFLIHYNSLLQLDNHVDVLHATVSHLLRVTPKCRTEMKHELLFSVIYPTFIVAKHRYMIRLEESAYFLTASCLNIFASLLNSVAFAEQFIQKGGLSYVLELVSMSEFSHQCCSILEIAIIVEIFKLMKENSEMAYYREMSSLSSVQMLFKSLSEMTDKCYKIYKLKLPEDKFEELCDVTAERETLAITFMNREPHGRKQSLPKAIKTNQSVTETIVEDTIEDYIDVLKNVCTFWKSCSSLCLYSPMFREYLVTETVFLDSYALLKLLLYYLCNCEVSVAETRVLIKIVEALLTVQFAVAEATGGRSKASSCALVRSSVAGAPALTAGAPAGGLRALADALVRVARASPSAAHTMPRITHAKVPPLVCASGSSSAECSSSEESAGGPYASEHSDPPAQRDDGYEADVEAGKLDGDSTHAARKLSTLSAIAGLQGLESAGGEVLPCAEYRDQDELAHPELCLIVVDILNRIVDKLLEGGSPCGDMARVGAGLARACGARLAGCAPTHHPHALLQRLLAEPVTRLLSTTTHRLQDLQRSILELVEVLASQSISSGEVRLLLRLFCSSAPPLGALLATLHRLVSRAAPNTPDCALSFPVHDQHKDVDSVSEDYVVVNSSSSQSAHAEATIRKIREAHLRAGLTSAWSTYGVMVGVEGAVWSPWLHGFAAHIALRTQTNTDAHQHKGDQEQWDGAEERAGSLAHVLSLGHDSLVLHLWLDTDTGCLVFRLSRPDVGSDKVVSEASVERAVPRDAWTQLAINVREAVVKRRINIQVTVFINGWEAETVSLPLQGVLVRKCRWWCVLAGSARAGAYHVWAVRVCRAPLLDRYRAAHLAAHGPHHQCQVKCECPNYPLILTPNLLDSDIDWDQVYEWSVPSLRELHDGLLVSFTAHAHSIFNLYHQTAAVPTVFSGVSGSSGGCSVPEALTARWAAAPRPSTHRGLPPAIYMLAGTDLLLFLFARVVELNGSAEEQATSLGILLRACRADNRLYAQLYSADTLDMLLTVLDAPGCVFSVHMLKVVLDASCGACVLCVGESGALVPRTDAVLLEPALIVLLVSAWRHLDTQQEISWEVETSNGSRESMRGSLWSLALCCVGQLLRVSARRHFNHYQMTRVGLLSHLLTACKERLLNSERPALSGGCASQLVRVVRALVGAPPLLDRLAVLADFLLLMHQASDTFVTHSRANFYFLLTPAKQEATEFGEAFAKRRQSKRSKRRPAATPEPPSSSSVTSEDTTQDNGKGEDTADTVDSSVESSKLIKGLINMQIKQGRKHNLSSTSENSMSDVAVDNSGDTAPEEECVVSGDAQTNGKEAQTESKEAPVELIEDKQTSFDLDGFVVVDQDDVQSAEASGGAEQSGDTSEEGVNSGWSVCSGLLQAVRDTLGTLAEPQLPGALAGALCPEWLLVLANHRHAPVRAALVRVVAALQRRATPDLAKKLQALNYYVHLANQISAYPPSWDLAAACTALLTKCDVPLEDQLDDDIWTDLGEESAVRAPPLLALLPLCVHDVPLAHNIALIVARLIDKSSVKTLCEVGVCEVAVRALAAVGAQGTAPLDGRLLLQQDLLQLLHKMAHKALALPHTMQTVVDIHHMLTFVEQTAYARDDATSAHVARLARDAQVSLYIAELDDLEERLNSSYTAHTKYTNYFTTVLSSAVSLGAESVSRVERGELSARHAGAVSRATGFLLGLPRAHSAARDAPLLHRLLDTLIPAVSGCNGSVLQRRAWWAGAGECAALLGALWWWAAAPAPHVRCLHPRLLRALYRAPPALIHMLTPAEPTLSRKLAVYLLMMLKHIHLTGESGRPAVELAITDWARGWAVATQAGLTDRLPSDALHTEADRLSQADQMKWDKQAARMRPSIAKAVFSKEALADKVTEGAMCVTRLVVDAQNSERKGFMEHLRRAHAAAVAADQRWRTLVDQHTHEQAVWHMAERYPISWQLDPTEGPGRVRVRLRRAHLHVNTRFLKEEHKHKADRCNREPPLRSVIGSRAGAAGGLVTRLQLNETISYMARVTYVTVDSEVGGELLLSDRCIHFVPEDEDTGASWRTCGQKHAPPAPAHSWPLDTIVQVSSRRWCLQELAAEVFVSSGHAHLLAFPRHAERAVFLKALAHAHLPNRTEPDTLTEAMSQWRSGSITNWEYLMRLNGLAGRSYNDLMQYPVLPFVIADYTSRILDLNDPKSFRDLSKPMAIQNKNREQHYINTYNDLQVSRGEGCSPLVSRAAHHYASLYSNSGGVLHYLVRLPPFTELFLNYQDNNFDMPDRTFHSLATTWRLITQDSPTDVKELIPELFYLPELFHNNEGLNLGVRQCGVGVDSVEVPPWAADARIFTLLHRQALEAPLVTERLPSWIDLVFGYKQTGQAAVDAINVFPACTYYGFDPCSLEDEVDRTAAAAMVRTYGQAPRQLLRHPHPHRATDLAHTETQAATAVWCGVRGASWGRYCGSPGAPPPAAVLRRRVPAAAALHQLPHARAVAVATLHTAPLPLQDESAAGGSGGSSQVGVVSWGHSDGVVRVKRRRDAPPDPLLYVPPLDQITVVCCGWSGGVPIPLILGHLSGRICVLRVRCAAAPAPRPRWLCAHRAPLAAIHACAHQALLVTASEDGVIVLWDLNKLSYIRTLPNRDLVPVSHITISSTLSDVASVHRPRAPPAPPAPLAPPAHARHHDSYEDDDTIKYKSLIRVHTVNARFVGSVKVSEHVSSVCYSVCAEGVGANCVAAALRPGGVRLYSAWDLRPVRDVPAPDGLRATITSLVYSGDCSLLFGCYSDGTVVAWAAGGARAPPPRILPALALL